MREDHPTVPEETRASSQDKAFSIKKRLVILLLLVLVPILLTHAYFSYDRYQKSRNVESKANLELARATAKAFDTFVQDILHQELAIGLAFASSQSLSDKDKNRILDENKAGNAAVTNFLWHNPDGIVTAATGQFVGMDMSDREYFLEIVAGKDWVVSDLLLSKVTRQPIFTICRGIRNERSELLGIIVAAILPAKLDRVLAVDRMGDAGVSLLDSKGIHVYRCPAMQYTWEQRNWRKLYPIIEEALKGKEVVTNVTSAQTGIERMAAFVPVPAIGWIASCSRAEDEVVGPIISATLQEAGFILLVGFVSLLVAVSLSRTISSSIITLRNYALSLGQGQTQNPLTISRPAEIKDLAEAFNKMAEEIRFREKALRESERREQKQLKAMNEDLERKVEQRTLELQETQAQYLHAEKLPAIGKLSASIAHEFNSPLQSIMTVLKGLKKTTALEEVDKNLLDLAIGESERMKSLIRSLRDFNRPSSDRKVLMDVHQSLESILLLINSELRRKRISMVLNYAERLPQILAVPDQIKQVFLNLLSNATDACEEQGRVITISTWQVKQRIAVAINDNGIGIEPKKIDHIFQPFYSTKSEVKGTGLGLSICYGIVQNHHGEIRVVSQPGEGSTFTVLLPINGE